MFAMPCVLHGKARPRPVLPALPCLVARDGIALSRSAATHSGGTPVGRMSAPGRLRLAPMSALAHRHKHIAKHHLDRVGGHPTLEGSGRRAALAGLSLPDPVPR